MSQPEDIRPPTNYLDPAIKAMAYIAGGLLTLAIIGEGVGAHSDSQHKSETNVNAQFGNTSVPRSVTVSPETHPAVTQAPRVSVESSAGVVDYVVPLGIVTAEVVGMAYGLTEWKKRRHPFSQPFEQPERDQFPLTQEEEIAFHGIMSHFNRQD